MKRAKLKYVYHDGSITCVRYPAEDEIVIYVTLCDCCNGSAGTGVLTFCGVRNGAEVRSALEAAERRNRGHKYVDEIIGIGREHKRGYLLDLETAGGVFVDAASLIEA